MDREVNEEKRNKFIENAGKRVNKVIHDIEILEPMARSSVYDCTKNDVEKMFFAMQDALDNAKAEFEKKFEGRAKSTKKAFSFDDEVVSTTQENNIAEAITNEININEEIKPEVNL